MNEPLIGLIFQSTLGLILLMIVMFYEFPRLRLDKFREQMFTVRSELFDYAASGKIEFSHPAYRLLRQSMNGFIRYGHQLSFFRLCMTLLMWKTVQQTPELEWTQNWERALKSIKDDKVKQDLIAFHTRSFSLVAERLVLGSPFLIAFLVLCLLAGLFHAGWQSLSSAVKMASADLTSRIVDPRLLDEEAARSAVAA